MERAADSGFQIPEGHGIVQWNMFNQAGRAGCAQAIELARLFPPLRMQLPIRALPLITNRLRGFYL